MEATSEGGVVFLLNIMLAYTYTASEGPHPLDERKDRQK
jgi:hypothetical protein